MALAPCGERVNGNEWTTLETGKTGFQNERHLRESMFSVGRNIVWILVSDERQFRASRVPRPSANPGFVTIKSI